VTGCRTKLILDLGDRQGQQAGEVRGRAEARRGEWTKVHYRPIAEAHFGRNPPLTRLAALVFSAWLLLVGCTGPVSSYSKAGSDVADFRLDSSACVQESRMSWGAGGTPMNLRASADGKREPHLYQMCMRGRGWTAEAPQ
jgi:hypothetical protein